ncbi:MAG: FAD-dependent monooxygenase, partial [Ilumatobacter sp.]
SESRFTEPTLDDLRAALVRVDATDYGAHSPRFISRFTDMTRQAVTYRAGRVLLAGDAAHVHAPLGGQGLNLGVQDSVNLGWKLARVVLGTSPDALLDTYHAERHPVAARVMHNTMAQRALGATDDRTSALRSVMSDLLAFDEPRTHMAAMISGLDIHYATGRTADDDHPMIGRRVPDLDLVTSDGPSRIYEHLHRAEPLLLDLDPGSDLDTSRWRERVRHIDATCTGTWELPVLGEVPAPSALLIRPDGHVAWAGSRTDTGLHVALRTWFDA